MVQGKQLVVGHAQALSGGRTVEEAVEVLMISSDEEEPDQDAQQPQHPSQAPGEPWWQPECHSSYYKPFSSALGKITTDLKHPQYPWHRSCRGTGWQCCL